MSLSDADITNAVVHWRELAGAVFVPHSEAEYLRLVALLDRLIDEVGEDESHPLASLMEVVGVLIEPRAAADGVIAEHTDKRDLPGGAPAFQRRTLHPGPEPLLVGADSHVADGRSRRSARSGV